MDNPGTPARDESHPEGYDLMNPATTSHNRRGWWVVNRIVLQMGLLLGEHLENNTNVSDHPGWTTNTLNPSNVVWCTFKNIFAIIERPLFRVEVV